MVNLEEYIHKKCAEIQCPFANELGCVAVDIKRKIANDGIGITVGITPDSKIAVYYCDIFNCEKWKKA